MVRRWTLLPDQAVAVALLSREAGVSPRLARLLANRGITDPAAARAFLGARLSEHLRSPTLFRDMRPATERLAAALRGGERVAVYGDYDVDGISGSAILIRFLRALGADPLLHIPNRLRDGYGLNIGGIKRLAEGGARLMVTVDCGGVSHTEIAFASSLGIDTIVCDHHQVSGTPLPAVAVLNPVEPDAGFPFRGLCGAGVAFYLAMGLRARLRDETGASGPDLKRYLDLVALGTIADLVPIVEENRVLVKYGLREMAETDRPGLVALKEVSGAREITSGVVGFRLAPRLNAGGRLADAARSVELLTTDDRATAQALAAGLDEENRARQAIEREILDEAVAMVEENGGTTDRRSIVLASPDWHPGVIGIVASRLVERYYRPTILIATEAERGLGRGSGRSIRTLNLHEALGACAEFLEGFGGHRMAAGLTIRPDRIPAFAAALDRAVGERTKSEDFVPVTDIDAEVSLTEIDEAFLRDIGGLEPHGPGNPEPVFLTRALRVRSRRVVGTGHLKLLLDHDGRSMPAIGFGMAERPVEEGARIDILHTPMVNEWNGRRSIETRLRDFRVE